MESLYIIPRNTVAFCWNPTLIKIWRIYLVPHELCKET